MMRTVSVIIPTFNRAKSVVNAVRSAMVQTRKPDEIIVVDDGSTDGTREALRDVWDAIRYYYHENAGPSPTRNKGIRMAQGRWLAFLDSDDRWAPEKLERQLSMLESGRCQVCFTGFVVSDGKQDLAAEFVAKRHPDLVMSWPDKEEVLISDPVDVIAGAKNLPLISSMVADRHLIEQAGMFDESLYAGEDTRLMYNLAFLSPVGVVNAPLLIFNRDPNRGSSILEDWRPATALRRMDCYIRVHCDAYWRLRASGRKELKRVRGRIGYCISRRAELACACKSYSLGRGLAWEGLFYAQDIRTIVRCLGALFVPGLLGARRRERET